MEKFVTHTGTVLPIPLKDVDTDMIIPAEYMRSISREGYGTHLFRRLREQRPDFPMNQKRFAGATLIIADSNFACGSSREHAVWAITGAGIKAVIGKSFADIFSGNAAKNGLLLVVLPAKVIGELLRRAEAGELRLTVDLEHQTVSDETGTAYRFECDPFRKHCLLNGLDDLDYLLSAKPQIDEYKKSKAMPRYFATTQPNHPNKD